MASPDRLNEAIKDAVKFKNQTSKVKAQYSNFIYGQRLNNKIQNAKLV